MKFFRRPAALAPRSIAFRLIVAVLAIELLSSIVTVALAFGFERHLHFHALDVIIHGHMESLLGAVQEAADGTEQPELVNADIHLPKDDIWEVIDDSGRILGCSPNWQGVPPESIPTGRGNFTVLVVNGHRYRVLRRPGSRIFDPGEPGGGHPHILTVVYGARVKLVWEAVWTSVEYYAMGSGVLLLVTGPLIAWLLHRGLLPLRQLAALASEVSVNRWHFDPPPRARTTTELAPLTHALENVLQRLEVSFVQQKVFVSDAAHELKTAVAVVKSSLQLLSLKKRSVDEYQAGLDRCLTDCLRLEELVYKMLALAREENAPQSAGEEQCCYLTDCLRRIGEDLETVAAVRQVSLALSFGEEGSIAVPLFAEDCTLLFSNLILNALQHSGADAQVEIRCYADRQARAVLVEIEDYGEGISADALPHVFERFYRGDPSRTRTTGGTGLGLAICKAIAERAGGSIAIASQLGQGTTVSVRLPLAQPASALE
jgi:signal transduction histidine kinase